MTDSTEKPRQYASLDDPFEHPATAAKETQQRLRVHSQHLDMLADLVERDLARGRGVAWWEPRELSPQRLLITDHLYACLSSIPDHLITAALHEGEWTARARYETTATTSSHTGRSDKPNEWLNIHGTWVRMHEDGVLLSLTRALDCLSAVLIVVCALELPLKTADLGKTRNHAKTVVEKRDSITDCCSTARLDVLAGLDEMIDRCGPPGWLDWMQSCRNTIAHRATRWTIDELVPTSDLLAPPGIPSRSAVVHRMTRNPRLSDAEALLASSAPEELILSEETSHTLRGLIDSATKLVDGLSESMLAVWILRRKEPGVIVQPFDKQWKAPAPDDVTAFAGYSEGNPPEMSSLTSHPSLMKRLEAAALDDEQRSIWKKPGLIEFVPKGTASEN